MSLIFLCGYSGQGNTLDMVDQELQKHEDSECVEVLGNFLSECQSRSKQDGGNVLDTNVVSPGIQFLASREEPVVISQHCLDVEKQTYRGLAVDGQAVRVQTFINQVIMALGFRHKPFHDMVKTRWTGAERVR